ncbi:MAG: RNA polymerase sigma factor, partial [Saprospiraceae bacterium]
MAQSPHPDNIYIKGIASNSSKILEEIYQKYSKAIIKLVIDNNGTIDDAQDVIQESLIVIYKKSKDKDFQLTSSFLTYFYAIARHVWWKMLKKKKVNGVSIDENLGLIEESNIESAILERERHTFYLSKLERLGDQCKQLLQYHTAGKKVKEIVQLMGFSSEGYARKRKFKCKEKLIKMIKEDQKYQEFI